MEDNELLYLYLEIKNDWAFNRLYNKYKKLIDFLIYQKLNHFFAVPLQYEDLVSEAYYIFLDTVINFKNNKNKSFKNYLINNLNWKIIGYLKKFSNKNYQVVNFSLSYQDQNYNRFNYYKNTKKQKIKISSLKLSIYEENVLKLKHKGFKNNDIINKLNLTYKQVDNAWQRVRNKIKKHLVEG